MKKTFDSVAFMRKRREELSRAYVDLTWQQIEEKIHQALKDNPMWKRDLKQHGSSSSTRITKHL
jgi:hypothetical protein